eukprot:jgi/Bigna1/89908/estExt_fgenesh1_pg.C_580007
MAVWAHATTIGLSSISLLFTVVMMFGTRGQVGWSVGEEDLNNDEVFVRFGLIGFETNSKGNEGVFGIYNYDSEGCKDIFAGGQVDSDTCDDCAGAGGAAFTFTFFGMVFLVVLLGAQYLRFSGFRHKHMIEFMFPALNLLNFLIAFCFFLVWTIWIGGCHQYLRDDEIFKEFDVTPGAGWALGFMIFIFSIVGGVFELVFAETLSPPIKTMPRVVRKDVIIKPKIQELT